MVEQAWLDQKARHSPKVLDCPKPGVRSPRRLLRPRRPLSPAEALKPVLGACSGRLCPLFQVVLGTGENQSSTKRSVGPPLQLSLHHPREKKKCFFKLSSQLYSRRRLVEEPRRSLPICRFVEVSARGLGVLPSPASR